MYFDPMYFLFIGPALLLSLWASWRTKSTFNKYSRVRTARGLTGAQAARAVLDELATAGVDLDAVTARLLDEGVAAFAASMRDLLAGLAPARAEI